MTAVNNAALFRSDEFRYQAFSRSPEDLEPMETLDASRF
jgi:hypothetical protein